MGVPLGEGEVNAVDRTIVPLGEGEVNAVDRTIRLSVRPRDLNTVWRVPELTQSAHVPPPPLSSPSPHLPPPPLSHLSTVQYASWDLAFHMLPFAKVDPEFAKQQLVLFLREWYMAPNGQIPGEPLPPPLSALSFDSTHSRYIHVNALGIHISNLPQLTSTD